MSIESSSSSPGQSTLRSNAIGLPGVLFQSITTMAPASAVAFSLGAAIPFAGGALPLAVPFFYRRERPQEFNALRHVLLPAIPFVVLIFPILAQFIPAPSPPLNLAAPICAAWFVLGLVIVILLSLRAPRALAQSNKVYLEDEPVLEEERSDG